MNVLALYCYRSLILLTLVTAMVTGCVKNNSKDQAPEVTKELNLKSENLEIESLNGSDRLNISEELDGQVLELNKEYSFEIEEIHDFHVQRGAINNKACGGSGPFSYQFFLVHQSGVETEFSGSQRPTTLLPGKFKIRVKMKNGGLCRNINMDFSVNLEARKDLVMTPDLHMAYECHDIEEGKKSLSQTYVRVQSLPIALIKISEFQGNHDLFDIVAGNNRLCSRAFKSTTRCSVNLAPGKKQQNPLVAKSVSCTSEGDDRIKGKAFLQMSNSLAGHQAEFSCQHQSQKISLKMKNCELLESFGRKLPTKLKESQIAILPKRLKIKTENMEGNEKLQFPDQDKFYLMLFHQNSMGYEQPLFNKFKAISRQELFSGEFQLRTHNILRDWSQMKPKNVKLVIFGEKNLTRGIYFLNFGELCRFNSDGIFTRNPGEEAENFCAQN